MKFQSRSKEEIAASKMFPAGRYPYEVIDAEEGKSKKSGREYIKLKLKVYAGNTERIVFDYLSDGVIEKIESFCDANGLHQEYVSGTLEPDDCVGKQGWAQIRQGKPNGDYPAKNEVQYYAVAENAPRAVAGTNGLEINDDDVPF